MRTRIVTAFVAGGLLVAAGLVTTLIYSPGTAQAREESDEARRPMQRLFGFLGEVLDDLVGDGTITQNQAEAILDATQARAAQLRNQHMAIRELISDILEDGVVTDEEASELPDDHWLLGEAFDEAWEDGELTVDEIREIRPLHKHPFTRGMRFGALLDDGGIDQDEYDNLGENHPLEQIDASDYLEDGLITPDELREIFSDLRDARSGDDA